MFSLQTYNKCWSVCLYDTEDAYLYPSYVLLNYVLCLAKSNSQDVPICCYDYCSVLRWCRTLMKLSNKRKNNALKGTNDRYTTLPTHLLTTLYFIRSYVAVELTYFVVPYPLGYQPNLKRHEPTLFRTLICCTTLYIFDGIVWYVCACHIYIYSKVLFEMIFVKFTYLLSFVVLSLRQFFDGWQNLF